MPVNRRYPVAELLGACADYFKTTGRRVTFEYILIKDINASPENAEELCRLTGKMNCHFNLIPINGTEHIKLYPPDMNEIRKFVAILEKHGKSVTVRRQMGDEIQAACGQLKRRFLSDK